MTDAPIHVLLVEDNPADARLLEEAVRESDAAAFRIEHVPRLASAEESIARRSPDVIVLDLTLPDSAGLETVQKMQTIAPSIPIVVLTGMQDEKLALEAVHRGVQDYLVKGEIGSSPARALRYAVERRRGEESLRASEERFRLLVEGVQDYAILMLDAEGRVASWNEGAQRIKGYDAAEIVGQHFSCFYTSEDARAGKPAMTLRRAVEEGRSVDEGWRVRKDGTRFWADVVATALWNGNGGLRGFAKVTRDITQRKAIETELHRAKEAAEAASKAKDNFLAILSHELRTPLTPVLATASRWELQSDLPAELRDDLSTIRRNVEIEARLIDDLLDLTRIVRGKTQFHYEVVDAHAILSSAVERFQGEIEDKGLSMTMDLRADRHHVWADPDRLRQVFANLLSNAVKFTPPSGEITVRSMNREGGRLLIQIIDSGIGIEPDLLPRLFNSFEQGEGRAMRRYGGLGLGLSIAKSLVEMQKGRIEVASDGQDRGATLSVHLEVIPAVAPQPPTTTPVTKFHGCRILLVDDHADTRGVMARLLKSLGCSVATAGTVKEALELVEKEPFDLLMSDIGLPDGSGIDIMRQVKARYQTKGIAISGFGQDEDLRRSHEAGFTVHLTKPVDFRTLQETIQSVAS